MKSEMFAFIAGVALTTSASLVSAQSQPSRTLIDVPGSQSLKSVGYGKCMSTAIDGSEGNEPAARLTTCTGRVEAPRHWKPMLAPLTVLPE